MRLFEAIFDANHRAVAGDPQAGLRPAEYAEALPIAALTCIDVRLNPLLPAVMGLPGDQFIWLRNAGNMVTGPLSSTLRSLALACAVEGAEEICVIGHTDCPVCRTTPLQLLERFKDLGVQRALLPENVHQYFGQIAGERQNVHQACALIRGSPLIGPQTPVHGLLLDLETGRLEWLVNGYQTTTPLSDRWNEAVRSASETVDKLRALGDFQIGHLKLPETKIGQTVSSTADWLSQKVGALEISPPAPPGPPSPAPAPAVPEPPPPPPLPPPPAARVIHVAEKVIQFTDQHWPKPTEPQPVPAPPPLPAPIPLPPRIGPEDPRRRRK